MGEVKREAEKKGGRRKGGELKRMIEEDDKEDKQQERRTTRKEGTISTVQVPCRHFPLLEFCSKSSETRTESNHESQSRLNLRPENEVRSFIPQLAEFIITSTSISKCILNNTATRLSYLSFVMTRCLAHPPRLNVHVNQTQKREEKKKQEVDSFNVS